MQKILAGKPVFIPTWELKVAVTPVISIDGDIFPAEEYVKRLLWLNSPDDLQIDIVYDSVKLDSFNFLNLQAQEATFKFTDHHNISNHMLEIMLTGKNASHTHDASVVGKDIIDSHTATWLIKVNLYIENLAICPLAIENGNLAIENGDFYIGENSIYVLEIQTPIYRWLLQHENSVIQDYSNHLYSKL